MRNPDLDLSKCVLNRTQNLKTDFVADFMH